MHSYLNSNGGQAYRLIKKVTPTKQDVTSESVPKEEAKEDSDMEVTEVGQ